MPDRRAVTEQCPIGRLFVEENKVIAQTDVGPLGRTLVKHARDAFVDQASIDREWRRLNYLDRPDFARAVDEYDRFLALLRLAGAKVELLPKAKGVGLDSIYVRDSSIVCDRGIILCNMGKASRGGEPAVVGAKYRALGIPIHGAITGDGHVEGGDVVWLRQRVLLVGNGYRTNGEGIRQLRRLVAGMADDVIEVGLPHWRGAGDVFHLMSILSPVADDTVLAYLPLMPVPLLRSLHRLDIRIVEVPDGEFEKMGCNVLATGERCVLALAGNPVTRRRLENVGIEVVTYDGEEISRKGAGGPTCLTRPLYRRN